MTNSNLPTLKDNKPAVISASSTIETIKSVRLNRLLMASGLLAIATSIGVFALTQFTTISVIVGLAGVIFLGARQLVQKSLSLTTNKEHLQINSIANQLELIKKEVSKAKFFEYVENEGTQAADQANLLLQQHKSLKNILSFKFEVHEMTYTRYLDGVEATCLAIAETLRHIKTRLENLSLTGKNKNELWLDQHAEVMALLKATEEGLNGLAKLFNSINQITTKEKHRDQLEHTMQQLSELADRAKIYSKK